ncbi:DUF882 domain-containing protein [Vibrio sp. sp1]|uniref:DUF882 domain-containing protein n=1 Tax=Vibrio TaxID=662 RepID=UPI001965A306|nr:MULTISPECIES: DUF882 domain-containing protein [Vibrio]MDA0421701.1 DUF882 domain-containing protein [Vibrio alginolyticus]MDW1614595.1 DUF882 domain-containing protein [Vibrio sp. Vb2881]MDW1619311.1 DUF882 domain-containing protein [Vibrio sp. Vb2864]MDW1691345.1 DUF882 domain-containing protein [Vibrio sp. Vb2853]MDW1710155.1 DUF882 domain-containing protein [Vibrio sp. Vb2865]
MVSRKFSRRDFLKMTAGGVVLASALPSFSWASLSDEPRALAMNNLNTGEILETCYFDGKRYINDELQRLNEFCRDHRRNEVHPMDRRLFDQISQIQKLIGTEAEVIVISGYRSPATNASLRNGSSRVAKKSMHMEGKAIDFRLDGVKLSTVRDAALSLKAGGVGYYPGSNFVHIDTGAVRSW